MMSFSTKTNSYHCGVVYLYIDLRQTCYQYQLLARERRRDIVILLSYLARIDIFGTLDIIRHSPMRNGHIIERELKRRNTN